MGKQFVCFPVRFDRDANRFWDSFYEMHQNKFFKNRQWLFSEFPELLPQGRDTSTPEGQESSVLRGLREIQPSRVQSQQGDSNIPHHAVLREKQQHTDYSAVHSREAAAFPGQHASFRILEVIDFSYSPVLIVSCDGLLCDMLCVCYRWAVVQATVYSLSSTPSG